MAARPPRPGLVALAVTLGLLATALAPSAPASDDAHPDVGSARVLVMFRDAIPSYLTALADAHGARVTEWPALRGAVLDAPDEEGAQALLDALGGRADVAAAELDRSLRLHGKPNDARYTSQWAPADVGLPLAWDRGLGSHQVRIAVLDTGADLDHEDLAANVCLARNIVDPTLSAEDDEDHGSHTAGIASAVTNNGLGIAGASQSCLLIGKVCGADGSCAVSDAATGIDWAVANGAHIISMSFGNVFHSNVLLAAVERAWDRGALLVASAGNGSCSLVDFPAAYDEVIAVAALQQLPPLARTVTNFAHAPGEIRAPYSNCGPEVELAAPGTGILSTVRGGYGMMQGTSMAAPLVAGIAGLVKAANPSLTNAQLRCILDSTAEDLGPPMRDFEYGYGKVRADDAVERAPLGALCQQPHAVLAALDEDP